MAEYWHTEREARASALGRPGFTVLRHDRSGTGERDLTPARLAAVRKFLSERGIDEKRIFVESRTDAKIKEPRLDVQLLGQPATD